MNLYWDLQNQKMTAGTTSTQAISGYDFVLRDTLPITLRVLEEQTNINVPYIVTSIEDSKSISFGAKRLSTYASDTEFLFADNNWAEAGSGTSTRYTTDLTLNTSALIDAIGEDDYIDCKAEFTLVNASNANELSTQFGIRIYQDVISGSEGIPTTQYPVIAQYTDDNGTAAVRLVNASGTCVGLYKQGSPYVYISGTGLWYPIVGNIVDGEPVIGLGTGEQI